MIKVLILALPLIVSGYNATPVSDGKITSSTLMCQQPDGEFYFVNWRGMRYVLRGANGEPDGIVFQDTAGKVHILHENTKYPDHCEDAGIETEV